jgi:integrase
MVPLSLKAGLRAIASLRWGCIREDDTVIELVDTKGGKPRTVPVNKELRQAIKAYALQCKRTADHDLVFTARHAKPGAPWTANAVAAWFFDLYSRHYSD